MRIASFVGLMLVMIVGSTVLHSAETGEVVIDSKGRKIRLGADKTWNYVEESTAAVVTPTSAEEVIEIWDTSLELLMKDSDENRYSNEVRLHLNYKNKSNSKVVAIVTYVRIASPLGKKLLENTFEDESVVPPMSMERNPVYWKFGDNPFIHDELYDALWQVAQNGTAKITTEVKKVVLADGTVLTKKKKAPAAKRPG